MTGDAFDELDFEYATAFAEKAVRAMSQYRVPPTPNNFHTWFKYSLGVSPDLKRAIDILIGNKRKFDAATNRDLFAMYVRADTGDDSDVNNFSQQLHSVMASAKQYLNVAIADNRSQMMAIGDIAERSEAGVDPAPLVENLLNELAKAVNRAAKLEARFAESTRELDAIRDSLSKSEERAKTDTLTGLPNRRALEEFFRKAQIAAMEKGEPLSVLLIDIDHFKKFNDSFGHGVGDQVLRLMASVLRERLRESDLPARYGGEELIAVLPGADLATCAAVAERIRRLISECRITRRSTQELLPSITVSIGVGQFQFGESMADLIERCDRALYLAKRNGRNRVVTEAELDREMAAS
ncbi:diguanylate cyclase [Bradyrhizobium erythrophlei]|uniref:diguanylate cyclase n=2 Tax=Bradyrhizobium erythrophlei TaxID=1437360 RepID=A0A1M5J5G9_9BRAD|nr:diguanylate cyclase [Bradyrhizobium erythrophlei]